MDENSVNYREVKCGVIADLLPGYVDNLLSEKSRELVAYHLENCSACREREKTLRKGVSEERVGALQDESSKERKDADFAERIRKKLFQKRLASAGVLLLVAAYLLVGDYILSRMVHFFGVGTQRPFYVFMWCWGLANVDLGKWLILNILLFIPLGFFVPLFLPCMRKGRWTYLVGACVSVGFEAVKIFRGELSFNTDWFLCNLFGTMIGYGLFVLVWAFVERKKRTAMGVVRRHWWSIFLYQIPLICVCLLIAVPSYIYQHRELGHISWEYRNPFESKPQITMECDLSEEHLQAVVYRDVPQETLHDGIEAVVVGNIVQLPEEYESLAESHIYKEFEMVSQQEAYESLCEGGYIDGTEITEIVFNDVRILYVTDTKGFYQPVYYFRGEAGGEACNYVVPAIK